MLIAKNVSLILAKQSRWPLSGWYRCSLVSALLDLCGVGCTRWRPTLACKTAWARHKLSRCRKFNKKPRLACWAMRLHPYILCLTRTVARQGAEPTLVTRFGRVIRAMGLVSCASSLGIEHSLSLSLNDLVKQACANAYRHAEQALPSPAMSHRRVSSTLWQSQMLTSLMLHPQRHDHMHKLHLSPRSLSRSVPTREDHRRMVWLRDVFALYTNNSGPWSLRVKLTCA